MGFSALSRVATSEYRTLLGTSLNRLLASSENKKLSQRILNAGIRPIADGEPPAIVKAIVRKDEEAVSMIFRNQLASPDDTVELRIRDLTMDPRLRAIIDQCHLL